MGVLLVNIHRDPGELAGPYHRLMARMPPITLAYLAAALEADGVPVAVHDDDAFDGDDGALRQAIRRARPSLVGVSLVTAAAAGLPRVVRIVREEAPNARIVAGNIHAEIYHRPLLEAGALDIVSHGEGERTLVELARAVDAGTPLDDVKGLSFLRGGEVVQTPPRPLIEDLDTLPFPAWHLLPMDRYRIFGFAKVRDPGILVLGSRGCPFSCAFCSLKVMGPRRRVRSVVNIADECEWDLERFGYVQPSFVDALFPLSKKEGLAYAAELVRRGLHRKQVWVTETRVESVDLELLQALRESGLRRIMFGIESGDAADLATLRKSASLDATRKAIEASRKAGVETIGFFILGIPGATRQSMEGDLRLSRELDLDFAKYTCFVPYPGTPIHDDLARKGELRDPGNWRGYTLYPSRENPPVYLAKGLTVDDLVRLQARAHLEFYLRPRMIARQVLRIRTLSVQDLVQHAQSAATAALAALRSRRRAGASGGA